MIKLKKWPPKKEEIFKKIWRKGEHEEELETKQAHGRLNKNWRIIYFLMSI